MKDWLVSALLSMLAVLAPVKMVIITVGILIFADLIMGMWAAHKRGEIITSAALRRTITKMLVYQTCVITGFMLEKYLLGGSIPVIKLIGGVIGVVEFKSIIENANTVLGMDLFKEIIARLGSSNDKKKK